MQAVQNDSSARREKNARPKRIPIREGVRFSKQRRNRTVFNSLLGDYYFVATGLFGLVEGFIDSLQKILCVLIRVMDGYAETGGYLPRHSGKGEL